MSDHAEITKSYNTRWDHHYAALEAYVAQEGTARVPHGRRIEFAGVSVNLGGWCATQRQRHHERKLPPGRARLLEALPGWVWGPLPPGPPEKVERNAEIRTRRAAGATLAELAEEFGITRQRVHQIAAS